tara:strand:- start:9402 stop:10229 length:828 start_codon:yes stop_codon:yes gene_type:complete
MELSDSEKTWIEHSYKLEGGQTKYQNQNFVVGTQITPFKKIQQALLELQSRDNTRVELQYRLDKNAIDLKKLNRQLKLAQDPLDKEAIEIEINKALYDRSIWEQKVVICKREIENFTSQLDEMVDKSKGIEYYLNTNEEEDKKYWISRMAKQAACDMISFGHVGTGNMDSIMNLPTEDQIQVLSGAVSHSSIIAAGVASMQKQMGGTIGHIINGGEFKPPQINGSEITSLPEDTPPPQIGSAEPPEVPKTPLITELKHDIPKKKVRLQSPNKSKD